MTLFLTFMGSLFLSLALCWPVQKFLQKKDLWDKPNDRSSHTVDTLRGGGAGATDRLSLWNFNLCYPRELRVRASMARRGLGFVMDKFSR